MWCGCAAPLLAHVNLLLAVFGGATLATAARLKWDPSTYIVLREVFPAEYRAAAVACALHGAALLLLAHLAVAALHATTHSTKRVLLSIYAVSMTALVVSEALFGAWLARRGRLWLASGAAQQLHDALELRQHLAPLLRYFSRWHPLPHHIEALIAEAETDAPRNVYVAGVMGMLLALLQPLAIVLAICASRSPPAHTALPQSQSTALDKRSYSYTNSSGTPPADHEKAPLRTAYMNGRIVIL